MNKPWQLGYIIAQGNEIIEKADFWLAWKDLKVSPMAAKVTGFKESKYNKLKQDPHNALDKFEKYLYNEDYKIVGHNILGFDVYIHNIHRRLCGQTSDYSYINRVIDTNCIARGIKTSIAYSPDDSFIEWQYKLLHYRKRGVKTNLRQMCKDYQVDFQEDRLHEALYDVEKTYELFTKLIWEIEI
jgi:DNA polymerase III alpha subunit (gram-positive type)